MYRGILKYFRARSLERAIVTSLVLRSLLSLPIGATDPVLDIHSPGELEAKRVALVHYIWGTAWDDVLARQPTVYSPHTPTPADALPPVSNVRLIEELVTTMSLPALSGGQSITHTSAAYLYHPQSPNGRVLVVHHGHGCALDGSDAPYNLDKTIQDAVAANYAVVAMRMPLYQRPSQCGSDSTSTSHDDMFTDPQRLQRGSPLQFFLEPIARALNYIQSNYPATYHNFNMVGLSGGGWTTTVYSALDPRITLSFPVAGSLPLDVPIGPGGRDMEQKLPAFYDLAGYRDLYVMGSYGEHRRQTQILNHKDNCCFVPPDQDAFDYACAVQSRLFSLGSGAFTLDYDDTSTSHQISLSALSAVILQSLEVGSAGIAPGSCISRFSWPSDILVHIVNQHSGKCMDVAGASTADQAKVQQYHCHDGKNQIWILDRNGEIVSLNSGKCLDVPSASLADNVLVQQYTCHGGTNQLWRATPRGEIINVNSGKCLDLPSGDVADQVQLQQFSCNNGSNQQWVFP
jgi:dienelactone hydrolase